MAKITFPRKEIEKHIALNEKTLERISLFGTTVESLTKDELELEILANRPDLLSLERFIRAFNAFENKATGLKEYRAKRSTYVVKVHKSVKNVRPYTVCAVVKDLKLDDEKIKQLMQLQEKLHMTIGRRRKKCAIGIYPLDKITFPVSFEAKSPEHIHFTPLGSSKEMNAFSILEKHPAGKEYAELLKGHTTFPVFVDSAKKILSMPPIINSQETGHVTTSTREVFIECSGHDKKTLDIVMAIVSTTLVDMGGTLYTVTVEDEQKEICPKLSSEKHTLKIENVHKLLGLQLTEKEISSLLARMGHQYTKPHVLVSPWRADVIHEVDLIEDIAIAYGYNNIKPEIPSLSTIATQTKKSVIRQKITELLAGLGHMELSSLHFITEAEALKANARAIPLENVRTEYSLLRPNLFIPLLRTLSQNTDSEYPQHLCEIGRIFAHSENTETHVEEKEQLIIASTPGNFTHSKQTLDYLMRMLAIEYTLSESTSPHLIDGRTGAIHVNNHVIGHLGEVHPVTLHEWKLKMPLSIIELDLKEIYALVN